MAFIPTIPQLPHTRTTPHSTTHQLTGARRGRPHLPIAHRRARVPIASSQDGAETEGVSAATEAAVPEAPFLLDATTLDAILARTMLVSKPLARVYSSAQHGFSHVAFFERQIPLGGVPSLLLARTVDGLVCGGYAASGFLARDDYREASTEDSMFVFRVDGGGNVMRALNTDPVQYDFYDYAVRFGAAMLGIPMNPEKHFMAADKATSSCRMPNGETSIFGEYTMAKLDLVEVLVARQYVEEVELNKSKKSSGFFSRLFG